VAAEDLEDVVLDLCLHAVRQNHHHLYDLAIPFSASTLTYHLHQGMLIGPQLQTQLRAKIKGLVTYPVLYAASIATNISVQRTDRASINKGVAAFKKASGCKYIVAGGYSQGAAVMHNVISKNLDAGTKAKIVGVALFGDTRNKQDRGHIPGLAADKSKVWCNKSDGVCGGGLNVNAGHLSYSGKQIREAATYLASKVRG
jgi:cutinase